MGLLETIGLLLGLAMLAGLNVYLTLFLVGLAVRMEWVPWPEIAEALAGFGHPLLIAVALGLFLVEFGIDKIPWADSLWDSIHTFLRPAGGIFLAVTALGPEAATFWQVVVALLAGTASVLTHLAKAGLRLNINTSPEPFSNIGASVVKDLAVFGGFFLVLRQPLIALFVFGGILAVVIVFTPASLRSSRAILWLIWKKLRVPAEEKGGRERKLPSKLHADDLLRIGQTIDTDAGEAAWAVPCVTGKTRGLKGLPRNVFGNLVSLRDDGTPLCFVGRRRFRKFVRTVDLADCHAAHESRFLSESLDIFSKKKKLHVVFRFHRGQDDLAERLAEVLNLRMGVETEAAEEAASVPGEEQGDEDAESGLAFPDEAVRDGDAENERTGHEDSNEAVENESASAEKESDSGAAADGSTKA